MNAAWASVRECHPSRRLRLGGRGVGLTASASGSGSWDSQCGQVATDAGLISPFGVQSETDKCRWYVVLQAGQRIGSPATLPGLTF
jgi:hypothetical protein